MYSFIVKKEVDKFVRYIDHLLGISLCCGYVKERLISSFKTQSGPFFIGKFKDLTHRINHLKFNCLVTFGVEEVQ